MAVRAGNVAWTADGAWWLKTEPLRNWVPFHGSDDRVCANDAAFLELTPTFVACASTGEMWGKPSAGPAVGSSSSTA